MKKRIVNLSFLITISVVLWFANLRYPNVYLQKAFYTFFALTTGYLLFKFILKEVVSKGISESKTRYAFRKVSSILYILAFLVIALTIWVEHPQALLVSYGVLAIGAVFALQDFFKNFVGGIVIFLTGIYRVGDRIEINSRRGDIIDIGILYTTILEIADWVSGDQATGKLSTIPNVYVLSSTVNNYNKDHPLYLGRN